MVLLSVSEFPWPFSSLVRAPAYRHFADRPVAAMAFAQKGLRRISYAILKLLWGLGVVSAILSCITGYLLSVHNEYDDTAVALHMWSGIAVAAISLLLFAKVAARQYDAIYKGGAVALFLLITATGHFGGSLTHGSDYLSLALLRGSGTDSAGIKPIADVQEALVYTDIVKPVLQTKCYSCHGPQKQKGGLRVDDSTHLLKGGEDGPVLLAGKPAESDLVKSLLLPREDKKHMPPKEKPQLTNNQIQLLHWWVEQGAPFHKKVKELEQPEKLKPALVALQKGEIKKTVLPMMPDKPTAPADAKAVAALKEKGVMVLPVAQGSNYLMAHFTNASDVTDKDLSLLLPLKSQLVWLKLGNTKISDSALKPSANAPTCMRSGLTIQPLPIKGCRPYSR
jgi:mono/diheme cytochrome c family protein